MEVAEIEALKIRAVEAQFEEAEGDFFEWSEPYKKLVLAAELDEALVISEVSQWRSGGLQEQILHARLLGSISGLSAERRFEEVKRTLQLDPAADVVDWLVVALRETRNCGSLAVLGELAEHPAGHVRFRVPGALSACAEEIGDIRGWLLTLSADKDEEVRWSAVFELAAWWTDTADPKVRRRLLEVASSDPVSEVRVAAQCAVNPTG